MVNNSWANCPFGCELPVSFPRIPGDILGRSGTTVDGGPESGTNLSGLLRSRITAPAVDTYSQIAGDNNTVHNALQPLIDVYLSLLSVIIIYPGTPQAGTYDDPNRKMKRPCRSGRAFQFFPPLPRGRASFPQGHPSFPRRAIRHSRRVTPSFPRRACPREGGGGNLSSLATGKLP